MLAQHRFRYLYFLGRLTSFSLCGLLAGAGGSIINFFLREYHLSALLSFIFGGVLLCISFGSLLDLKVRKIKLADSIINRWNRTLSVLMLRDQAFATFLFGFFTVALPCGQTLIVFSACALYGDPWTGFINGLCFALLTSPSLLASMHASYFLQRLKPYYRQLTALCGIGIGMIAIGRGLAELDIIPHLILNEAYHLVIL
jgi:sulfite exporter TauE/SafE